MVVASVTSSVTTFVGDHGLYAIFILMLVAAVFPTASELVMLYAGALASGAFASAHVTAFGHEIDTPAWAFLAVAVTGVVANTLGAVGGWAIGAFGGRPFIERHGRSLHVSAAKLDRAERNFEDRGALAVPVGFALPLVRSFVAIPAGIMRIELRRFVPLALIGNAVFCFVVAGIGWAVGKSYERIHGDLRFVDAAVVAALVLAALAYFILRRRRRSSTLARGAGPSR
jgi:membrane protein DedA with SNARE-associated domain